MRRKLWTWNCPLKIKIFLWLLLEDKLLTWNNILKRGWQGPGLCLLCRGNEESTFHIFFQCPFTCTVWSKILTHYKLIIGWSGSTMLDCFDYWARKKLLAGFSVQADKQGCREDECCRKILLRTSEYPLGLYTPTTKTERC